MRVTVTVIDPVTGDTADVVLEVGPDTTVREISGRLAARVGVGTPAVTSGVTAPAAMPAEVALRPVDDGSLAPEQERRPALRLVPDSDPNAPDGAPDGSPDDPPRRGAAERLAAAPPVSLYVAGELLDPDQPVVDSPLRDGALVSVEDPAGCVLPEPHGLVEVRVVGGPGAGAVHRLGVGTFEVGSTPHAAVPVETQHGPDALLTLTVDVEGHAVLRPGDGVEALLDGEPLDGGASAGGTRGAGATQEPDGAAEGVAWTPGAQIAVGEVLLELDRPQEPDAALQPSEDGAGLDYNRPPRLLSPARTTSFRLPSPPAEQDKRPLPLLMAALPVVMAVAMVLVSGRLFYLLFGLMTPVMLLGNFWQSRRAGKQSYRRKLAQHREQVAQIEADAAAAVLAERDARRHDCPDPASLLLTATGPRRRLWERRRYDEDHLLLRFGTAEQPSEVTLDDPTQLHHRKQVVRTVLDVPVTVPLRERGVVGVAGPPEVAQALARWAVAQLAALHSPADVSVCVLTEPAASERWEWVRWLPHNRAAPDQSAVNLLGNDTDTVSRRIAEVSALVAARTQARAEAGAGRAEFEDGDLVVVVDGARRMRALPGMVQILRDGPAVGVYALCVDADERLLPEECHAVVVQDPDGLRVQQQRGDVLRSVRPDLVSALWCERLSRALAPVRDVSGAEEEATVPTSSRLLDVLELEPPTADAIAARWHLGGRTTEFAVGESLDGAFALDLRRDGPHGLVAGTTGAGKSELLQTVVASLAVANRPDAMTFVLVDYKGGSAFKDCVQLPHTVGMVTDLDTHLVSRALESLSAELRRREHQLAEAGAKDIEDYTDLLPRNPDLTPMPRLLIVIDEFASLVRELPDFVTGLVNIAQRGRSLGIHLLLATQRPSGVVSPEIRANTNLRIALRVTDATESQDVIDAPDAARISKATPGRAYVRLGHTSLVPFQAGRVGGRRPGARGPARVEPWLAEVGWKRLGHPPPQRPRPAEDGGDAEVTDLSELVAAIREADRQLGLAPQHSPWLSALPETLLLDQLEEHGDQDELGGEGGADPAAAPYALEDLPARQERRTAGIDLTTFGHLYVVGSPRSGRSQVLRTIAGSLARARSCADVHLYGVDCGNGALLPMTELPHCGAVVTRTQTERATRLIGRLGVEVTRRQETLAEQGYADLTEQRTAAARDGSGEEPLPHLVVLLDRWEGFTSSLGEIDNGRLTEEVQRLLREGASVGVHLVIAGDRTLLSSRMATLAEEKLVLRLADRNDYSLAGLNPKKMPEQLPPGRAFRAESGVEAQIALLAPDASGQGQGAALTDIGARVRERDAGVPRSRRPFRVDVLPKRLDFDQAWQMQAEDHGPLWGLVGVGGDELAAVGPDLGAGAATFVAGGPAKSGRSTLLLTMARSFLAGGAALVVVTPRPSPLRELEGHPGVARVITDADLGEEQLRDAVSAARGQDSGEDEQAGGARPVVVLVDDAELLKDCPAKGALRDLVRTGGDRGIALVVAGVTEEVGGGFSGWLVDVKKNRQGALLSPQNPMDGDLLGVRLPRSMAGQPVQPGRALVHLGDGELRTVQVPATALPGPGVSQGM
ncbi:MAG TPA: FtsK/SpoIIIE domain-containing protein [Nocardioidaceae bacterium]|nr:FtsK/SpoIIIE domain-containing protein [Nocardioidaceae bacterium]